MDYVKRLQRWVDNRKPEILVTGSTLLEVELLARLRPDCYTATETQKSKVTGDYYQWWHLQEPSDVKYSARREGLIPL